MGIDLEVKVLSEIGHNDRSEPQGRGTARDRLEEVGSEAAGRRTEIGFEAWPSRASGLELVKLS